MPVNDLFGLAVKGDHSSGQEFAFTQDYKCTAVGTGFGIAADLGIAFNTVVAPLLLNAMSAFWSINLIEVRNYDDDDDSHEIVSIQPGVATGNGLPWVLAVGMRSPRQAVGVNRSRHQMPLGTQSWLSPGGQIADNGQDILYPLQQQLGLPLVRASNGTEFTPIITRKTYVNHVLTAVEERAVVTGQWETNIYLTTSKARQGYLWNVLDEPA